MENLTQHLLYLNVFICIITGIVLSVCIKQRPHLLIKPSIIYLLFFYILIQIPATLHASVFLDELENWYDYLLLVQLYPLTAAIISSLTFHDTTKRIWERIGKDNLSFDHGIASFYFLFVLVITGAYLYHVGPQNTGIYAIIFGTPAQAALARESSLKTLDSAAMRYSYSLLGSALAPVLVVLLSLHVKDCWRKDWPGVIVGIAGVIACFIAVSFPGHRWGPMLIVFAVFVSFQYRTHFRNLRWKHCVGFFTALSLIMIAWTARREGVDFFNLGLSGSLDYFFATKSDGIQGWAKGGLFWATVYRVFVDHMKSGLDYVQYVAQNDYLGLAAIPRLAYIMGVPPLDAPNIMNSYYYPTSIVKTGSYTTGFVFAYYSYFGIVSVLLSLVLTGLVDGCILLYDHLDNSLILPVVTTVSVASINLVGAEFFGSLLTHGLLSSIVLALGIQALYRFYLTAVLMPGAKANSKRPAGGEPR
ncbi:MAG: hypothetical protein RIN56_05590 [Sporomusaceae bacterium]|nr:hypothetical protein [Sporomusaceae bacterium]